MLGQCRFRGLELDEAAGRKMLGSSRGYGGREVPAVMRGFNEGGSDTRGRLGLKSAEDSDRRAWALISGAKRLATWRRVALEPATASCVVTGVIREVLAGLGDCMAGDGGFETSGSVMTRKESKSVDVRSGV